MKKRLIPFTFCLIATLLSSCGELSGTLSITPLVGIQDIHSDAQNEYLTSNNIESCSARGTVEESLPKGIKITWSKNIKSGSVKKYLVHISENSDFSSSLIYETSSKNSELEIYNLKINTEYYYKVEAISNKVSIFSDVDKFLTTSIGPRNIYVDGVTNFRDLGGENIKQGLIYRSATFDNNTCFYPAQDISTEGIKTCLDILKIKTEIDIRANYESELTSSKLGESVSYHHIPMTTGQGQNMLTFKGQIRNKDEVFDNPKAIKDIFEILKDENNYPLDFHCIRGTDRTGLLSFLIKGLCGDTLESIQKDYMFSNFAMINGTVKVANMMGSDTLDNQYGYMLLHYDNGETLQEKIYNYLKDEVLIETSTLDTIKNILTK